MQPLHETEPVLRVFAMPADVNINGDIFGGWLVGQMDLGAGLLAARCCKGRAATVSIDGMSFLSPVSVGDEVSVYGKVVRIGRTSMTITVEAWRRANFFDESNKVTEAIFTYVAIDENGRPRPVIQE